MTTEPTKPKLIKTRRSCVGCGMRPGALYNNGLCDACQFPRSAAPPWHDMRTADEVNAERLAVKDGK